MKNVFITVLVCTLTACAAPGGDPFTRMQIAAADSTPEEKLLVVDCLTAGQVRKLGAYATTIAPRRALRVSAAQCEAAGGEYVSTNTNPAGALRIWLPFASEGDTDAQVNVGELYERGVAGAPDYVLAAQWYERAISKGNVRAMVNLAALYERGAGVLRDPVKARALYRQASGIAPMAERPRIQLIDPPAVVSTLRLRSSDVMRVKAAPGPYIVNGRVVSETPLSSLTVNGAARPVGERGLFSASITLGGEPVQVQIAAVDARGNSTQANFMLGLQDIAAAPARAANVAAVGTRYALVIANQNYKHYEKLATPHADGQAIKAVLEQRFGFEVTLLRDATRRDVLAALTVMRAKAGTRDQVLVYYAGHGEMDPITQRGYWVPVDGEQKNTTNWISIIDVSDQLAAMQARHAMVIADSCYSGTMTRSAVPELDQAIAEDVRRSALDQLGRNRSRVAMSSGGLEPVVDGGGGRNSIFARSLLDVLTNVQQPVEGQQLYNAVAARFAFLSRRLRLNQTPEYAPIRFAGHESGDFVLTPNAL